jgi:hypothetical protein
VCVRAKEIGHWAALAWISLSSSKAEFSDPQDGIIGDPLRGRGADRSAQHAGDQACSLDRRRKQTIRIDRPITKLSMRQGTYPAAAPSNEQSRPSPTALGAASVARAALEVPDLSGRSGGLANMPPGQGECFGID